MAAQQKQYQKYLSKENVSYGNSNSVQNPIRFINKVNLFGIYWNKPTYIHVYSSHFKKKIDCSQMGP